MVVGSVFLECRLHLGSQLGALGSQRGPSVNFGQDFGSLAQRSHGKEIRRHEKEERRRIVRGTEYRSDQPDGIHRLPLPMLQTVSSWRSVTRMNVSRHPPALLLAEGLEYVPRWPPSNVRRTPNRHPSPASIHRPGATDSKQSISHLRSCSSGAHLGLVAHPLMVGVRVVGVERTHCA